MGGAHTVGDGAGSGAICRKVAAATSGPEGGSGASRSCAECELWTRLDAGARRCACGALGSTSAVGRCPGLVSGSGSGIASSGGIRGCASPQPMHVSERGSSEKRSAAGTADWCTTSASRTAAAPGLDPGAWSAGAAAVAPAPTSRASASALPSVGANNEPRRAGAVCGPSI
eukprot:scaffold35056_cov101-Isochrysis_galbana.AAC.3